MLELYHNNGNVFIFDVNDWATLRKTHRILGALVGNVNITKTFPLKLLPEEALLLVDKGIAKVVDRTFETTYEDREKHEQFETALLEEEKHIYKNIRKRQLEVMIDDIVTAKRKRGDTRSKEEIFNDELEKSSQITKNNMIWPISLKSSNANESIVSRNQLFKNTTQLKYHVYKDLHEKGYFVTSGLKFGADFLVYLGDPVAYHAIFIVHCIQDPDKDMHSTEIVAFGRLASSVRKRAVLASLQGGEISYITINWIDA